MDADFEGARDHDRPGVPFRFLFATPTATHSEITAQLSRATSARLPISVMRPASNYPICVRRSSKIREVGNYVRIAPTPAEKSYHIKTVAPCQELTSSTVIPVLGPLRSLRRPRKRYGH